jgi:hypothetical protein
VGSNKPEIRFSKVCKISEFGFAEGTYPTVEEVKAKVETIFREFRFSGDFLKDFSD